MCTPQLIQQAAEIKAQSMSAPSAVPSPLPGQPSVDSYNFNAEQISDVFQPDQIQYMMSKQYEPMPQVQTVPMIRKEMAPIKRQPTVGEILGIPPGSVPGI